MARKAWLGKPGDFEVAVHGTSLGHFGPGDSVDFSGYPGGGVSRFTISGIVPGADLDNINAFPLRLVFDGPYATFNMTSESAPAVPSMNWIATAVLGGLFTLSTLVWLRRVGSGASSRT